MLSDVLDDGNVVVLPGTRNSNIHAHFQPRIVNDFIFIDDIIYGSITTLFVVYEVVEPTSPRRVLKTLYFFFEVLQRTTP